MDDKSLVEKQGVNSGSDQQTEEGGGSRGAEPAAAAENAAAEGAAAGRDVLSGGDADAAPEAADHLNMTDAQEDSELLGAPDDRLPFPGQTGGASGQDSGSIE